MNRRSFLLTLSTLSLGGGLAGCQSQDRSMLRLLAIKGSLPPQFIGEFARAISGSKDNIELAVEAQFDDIFKQLKEWYKTGEAEYKGLKVPFVPPGKSAAYIPNLVSLGEAWLADAIRTKSIRPIDLQTITNWGKLAPRWQELVRRDDRGLPSNTGQVWGVPYRWGTTLILYRADKLAEANIPAPKDWADLWNPQLRQRISVLDRSRETIGLTLKKLGNSYNLTDLDRVPTLRAELAKLHRQVKFYSADYYLQPLVMGDTWVAVGWSPDALDLMDKNNDIRAIVPASGTALWADLWVQPTTKNAAGDRDKLAHQWIDYSLQLKPSEQISIFTSGTAPLLTSIDRQQMLADIRNNPISLPPPAILDKSEFIYPLEPQISTQFDRLWQEMRQGKLG